MTLSLGRCLAGARCAIRCYCRISRTLPVWRHRARQQLMLRRIPLVSLVLSLHLRQVSGEDIKSSQTLRSFFCTIIIAVFVPFGTFIRFSSFIPSPKRLKTPRGEEACITSLNQNGSHSFSAGCSLSSQHSSCEVLFIQQRGTYLSVRALPRC